MRRQLGVTLTLLLSGVAFAQTQPSSAGSQSSAPNSQPYHPLLFLFRDDKAFRVGDIVTVLVTQTAVASATSQTQTQKQINVQTQAGAGVFSFIPQAGLQHQGSFASQAQERKNLSVITTIACRVVEVSPTGLLRIEGSQEFTIDKRKQSVKLSGWVRPTDISPNNTVLSTQVAEARLDFKGDWKTRRGKNLLERIVEGFNRILRILF
ncbi:Flagellar L-ring protein [bacterium HR17]|uniref:Flagellar L-ring protein n=1 Tax=Candidatus Fervidibacter japonicus TaxID=2035412 RepID=A0A2H5XCW2_9BACT|nr:Flagellar L-ring protein [bacterium HR17]